MKRLAIVCSAALVIGAGHVLAGQAPPGGQPARGPAPPTPACGPNVAMKNVAKDSRCFELRTYTVREGSSIDLLHSRFRDHTNALFKKHGMTIVGFWQPVAKPDQLIYLLAYKDGGGQGCGVGRVRRRSGMGEGADRDGRPGPGRQRLHERDRLRPLK